MRKIFIIGLLCGQLLGNTLKAQVNYAASAIPAALMQNASVIVRNEEQKVSVKSERNMVQSYSTAITIVNSEGDYASSISEYYDPFSVLSNLRAWLYDANGHLIKAYKTSDFKDKSMTSEGTLFDAYRQKELKILHPNYPYTVVYSFERSYNGYLTLPGWQPVTHFSQSVEKSAYIFEIPQKMSFRLKSSAGLPVDSVIKDQNVVYKWSASQIQAFEYEPYSTGISTVTPWLKLSPDQFNFDGAAGHIKNWNHVGSWIDGLNRDGQILTEQTKSKIRSLVSTARNDQEKIAILYRYLQSNTRYVSIQLGIGGFKPISATQVASVNYGDCKGLSNYMKAMLAVVDIPSNLVILGSGRPSLDQSYASFNQANHMILCVPGKQDTTWLECTSNYKPTGYIGYANSGRKVLLIKPEGGELVGTPIFKPEDNTQYRKALVKLSADGGAAIDIQTNYANAQYEENLYRMLEEPVAQRKKILQELSIPQMEIQSLSYRQPDQNKALMNEHIELKSEMITSTGAGKLFLTLNLLNRKESVPLKIENRKTSFSLPFGYEDHDEIHYELPAGYSAEFIPKDIELKSAFGTYSAKTVQKGNMLIYTRKILLRNQTYAADEYNNLVAFYKQIYQTDKQKAILVKI